MTKAQYYGKLIFSLGLGRHSKFDLSGGFGYLQDRFYPTKNIDYSAISQDEANYKLGQLKISYDFNTLDNQIYPSTGTRIFVAATGVLGNMEQYSNINQPYLYDELKWAEAEFDLMRFCCCQADSLLVIGSMQWHRPSRCCKVIRQASCRRLHSLLLNTAGGFSCRRSSPILLWLAE